MTLKNAPKTLNEIISDLTESKNKGHAIGIKLKTPDTLIVTAVEHISKKSFLVKPYCLYGDIIPQTEILFNNVQDVKLLRVYYEDPFYVRLRNIKSNVRTIKNNINKLWLRKQDSAKQSIRKLSNM